MAHKRTCTKTRPRKFPGNTNIIDQCECPPSNAEPSPDNRLSDRFEVHYNGPVTAGKWRRAAQAPGSVIDCNNWIAAFRKINPPYVGTKFRIVQLVRTVIEVREW